MGIKLMVLSIEHLAHLLVIGRHTNTITADVGYIASQFGSLNKRTISNRKGVITMMTNNTMKKNYVKFISKESNLGWYYTKYNPDTKEGEGWFGTESKPEYFFEDLLMYDEVYEEDILKSRTCGIGEGCFWTDFQ